MRASHQKHLCIAFVFQAALVLNTKKDVAAFAPIIRGTKYQLPYTGTADFASTTKDSATTPSLKKSPSNDQLNIIGRRSEIRPLRYRELDENDSDTALLKVKTRTPPGFDVNEALAERLKKLPKTGVNFPFIKAIVQNQLFVLAAASIASVAILTFTDGLGVLSNLGDLLHWNGDAAAGADLFDLTITPTRLAMGVIGALPAIAIGSAIENSDNRAFSNVNFSTIIMVMTLFGRRKAPPPEFLPEYLRGRRLPLTSWNEALLQSFAISSLTGLCEESVFRGIVPSLIYHYRGGSVSQALIGQAVLFGLGHATPGTSLAENSITMALQGVNGLWFGMLYLLSGGDIVPCIIAHAVYDLQVFFFTWMAANAQIEYAESMYLEPLPSDVQQEVQRVKRSFGSKVNDKVLSVAKRLFFTFDFDKNKTLSLSEVRKGISYLFLQTKTSPPPQDQVDAAFKQCIEQRMAEGAVVDRANAARLAFPDFVRLFMTLRVQTAVAA